MKNEFFCIVNADDQADAEATARLANATVPHMSEDFRAVTKKELAELSVPQLKTEINKAKAFDDLVSFMGHLQNGSQTNVSIWQDDAAQRDESVHLTIGKNNYYSSSLIGCIQKAAAAGENERD